MIVDYAKVFLNSSNNEEPCTTFSSFLTEKRIFIANLISYMHKYSTKNQN